MAHKGKQRTNERKNGTQPPSKLEEERKEFWGATRLEGVVWPEDGSNSKYCHSKEFSALYETCP